MILNDSKLSKIDFPGAKCAEETLHSKQTFIVCKEQGAKENKPKKHNQSSGLQGLNIPKLADRVGSCCS